MDARIAPPFMEATDASRLVCVVVVSYQEFSLSLLAGYHAENLCKNLAGPCPAPTYLPTYLPYLWETKKEITGWVKVGYYTN